MADKQDGTLLGRSTESTNPRILTKGDRTPSKRNLKEDFNKLKPFQKKGVERIRKLKARALLADEQGLGKTIQAPFVVRALPKWRPCFIICPSSVKYVWQAEAALHFNMAVSVIEGRKASARLIQKDGVYVLNYDILYAWRDVINYREPKLIIMDECHYIKNIESQRSRAALSVCRHARGVLGLSGTPLTNKPIELWPTLKAIAPDLFPSREDFAWEYCKPTYTRWGWAFEGCANEDKLHGILKRKCMIRRRKSQVLKELPSKQRIVVPYKLPNYQKYKKAEVDFLRWLEAEKDLLSAKKAKKATALTKVGYLLRYVSELKREWMIEWVRDFLEEGEEKLVAFTSMTSVIDRFKKEFSDQCVFVDGRVTGLDRTKTVRLFQTSPNKRLFLGNTRAAGTGITLTSACNLVYLDMPWSPGDLLQSEDRIHRIGQKKKVSIYYLVALDTIEEKLSRTLQKKAGILEEILNGKATPDKLDIYNELIQSLKRPN